MELMKNRLTMALRIKEKGPLGIKIPKWDPISCKHGIGIIVL